MNDADVDDTALLKAYVEAGDERAFRRLVDRHAGLVYGAARRQLGAIGHPLAEDVTQAVFVVLARKASRVRGGAALPAWLLQTTRNLARDAARAEARRRRRERRAAASTSEIVGEHSSNQRSTGGGESSSDAADARLDEQLAPLLDDALARLNERDRIAITLRFLQGMSIAQVAAATGATTQVTQKRIVRAIAKMRESLARRGKIIVPGVALTAAITRAAGDAPAGLAARASDAALAAHHAVATAGFFTQLYWKLTSTAAKVTIASTTAIVVVALATVALMTAHNAAAPQQSAPVFAAGPTTAPSDRIKVGVLLSQATASGWHGSKSKPFDITHQNTIRLLKSPKLDLYVILEPGPNPTVQSQAAPFVAADHVIDGSNAAVLRRLDVIVAGHNWHMRPEVLAAVREAVGEGGVGMLQQAGFAIFTPSFTPEVCEMIGIGPPADHFLNTSEPRICHILGPHPVLPPSLAPGDIVHVESLCGAIGPMHGIPLISAETVQNEAAPDRTKFIARQLNRPVPTTAPSSADSFSSGRGDVFCPLYVTQFGNGRVIACQWHEEPPVELDPNRDGSFYVRCIQWLADRPVE